MDAMKVVGVVGPCAAGKTTLTAFLKGKGYNVRHIAQEHSYVQNMWKKITKPDILIYLEVDYPATIERKNLDWTEDEYREQIRRLSHAREHANLIVDTNRMTAEQVFVTVEKYLLNEGDIEALKPPRS
jgi:thymidylate kinase